ncbi:MAG: hypothetical protein EOP49_34680, partial [Sphingobacteriales bacterium]
MAAVTFGLVSCPVMGQELPKKQLTPDDYKLWETLNLNAISHNGNWLSYTKTHSSGTGMLYIKNIKTGLEMAFPNGADGRFAAERSFAFLNNDTLKIVNLTNGSRREIRHVLQYSYSQNNSWLVTSEQVNGEQQLCIYDKDGHLTQRVPHLVTYQWNVQKNAFLYHTADVGKSAVGLMFLSKKIVNESVMQSGSPVSELTWNKSATAVAFYSTPNPKGTADMVHYFNLADKRLYSLKSVQDQFTVKAADDLRLTVSDDGQAVYFQTSSPIQINPADTSKVEIWRNDDKALARTRKLKVAMRNEAALAVWYPHTGQSTPISDATYRWVTVAGRDHALVADPLVHEPQFRWFAGIDVILVNLKSDARRKILENQNAQFGNLKVSKSGRYLTYYREANWWIYDVDHDKHINVTHGLNGEWVEGYRPHATDGNWVFGIAGWTSDQKYALFYDRYDIWAISPAGMMTPLSPLATTSAMPPISV